MSFLSFNMKLKLLSYSSPLSLSSSPSFDATNNICSSKSSATTAGCLAAILRRFLCSQSLPTHPSDHITHSEEVSSILCEKQSKENFQDTVMPTIVARLMGLDAIPNTSPSSITRSRSMNSLDFKSSSDQNQVRDNKHRRVQSSTLSIRELPTFFEVENDEFFVLSFGNGGEDKEKRSRGKRNEVGYGELKQTRSERCKNKNKIDQELKKKVSNKPEKPCIGLEITELSTPEKNNEVCDGAKLRKKKKVKSIEMECSSEDSSPVSVLDFDQFIMSELDTNLVESNSRRKLSPEPDQNYDCQSRRNDNNLMNHDARKIKKSQSKRVGSGKRDFQSQNYLDICDQIYKMTEVEVANSNWLYGKNPLRHEDIEDICADLELQIHDQCLDELVHQLIGLAM